MKTTQRIQDEKEEKAWIRKHGKRLALAFAESSKRYWDQEVKRIKKAGLEDFPNGL